MKFVSLFPVILFLTVACQSTNAASEEKVTVVAPIVPIAAVTPAPTPVKDPFTTVCEMQMKGKPVCKTVKHTTTKDLCTVTQDDKVLYSAKHNMKYCEDSYSKHVKVLASKGYTCK